MKTAKSVRRKRPYLFLFDGYAKGVEDPALGMFTGALLKAISIADPKGTLVADFRGGLPGLSDFAEKISAVSSGPKQSSHTVTHDMALYRLLLWDMSQALSAGRNAPDSLAILKVLRARHEECLALSDVPDHIRTKCDAELRRCPGYIGSCAIDAGNPVMRRAFYDRLMHFALISGGTITQERTSEGDEYFELEGAREFSPHGLRWRDDAFGSVPKRFRLENAPLSKRGALSEDRLNRKTQTSVEGRVFHAIMSASWTDRSRQTYEFTAAEPGQDILQAILPDGKFTHYLFNRDHKRGGAKASFIIDELGFDPEDWRYLAAQFYDGLLLSKPRDLRIHRWEDDQYGARFNTFVQV